MSEVITIKWACPKCKAPNGSCGNGKCGASSKNLCGGFTCECDLDDIVEASDHGDNFSNVCHNAECDHCGYEGRFPVKPKGLQAWEKKALEAGWVPPANRKKELGL